jgi:hypothetical protein
MIISADRSSYQIRMAIKVMFIQVPLCKLTRRYAISDSSILRIFQDTKQSSQSPSNHAHSKEIFPLKGHFCREETEASADSSESSTSHAAFGFLGKALLPESSCSPTDLM